MVVRQAAVSECGPPRGRRRASFPRHHHVGDDQGVQARSTRALALSGRPTREAEVQAAEGYHVQSRLGSRVGRRVLQRDWRDESGILRETSPSRLRLHRSASATVARGQGRQGLVNVPSAEVCQPRSSRNQTLRAVGRGPSPGFLQRMPRRLRNDPAARHRPAGVGSSRAAPDRAGRSAVLRSHPRTSRSRAVSRTGLPTPARKVGRMVAGHSGEL
jgi:hypothetical protein